MLRCSLTNVPSCCVWPWVRLHHAISDEQSAAVGSAAGAFASMQVGHKAHAQRAPGWLLQVYCAGWHCATAAATTRKPRVQRRLPKGLGWLTSLSMLMKACSSADRSAGSSCCTIHQNNSIGRTSPHGAQQGESGVWLCWDAAAATVGCKVWQLGARCATTVVHAVEGAGSSCCWGLGRNSTMISLAGHRSSW